MMRLLVVIVLGAIACGGKVPETRFYRLAEPPGPSTPGRGVALAIEPFSTEPAYDDERIVYRTTPYRLDYYDYHRWSAPPGVLIASYLERAFEQSGRLGAVTRDDGSDAPVTLGGRVIAIEEVDVSKTKWVGRVVVELTLTDTLTGDVLWTEQFEETEPLGAQSPEGLARALSDALERIAARVVPIVSTLAERTARARDAEPPRQGRAARRRR